jgi:alanine-synthesizing transaminase
VSSDVIVCLHQRRKLRRFVSSLRGSYTLGTVFSRRSSRDRSPNAVHALLATRGEPRFDLTSSNPTSAGIAYPTELLGVLERAQAQSRVYRPEPFGLLTAREAVARLTGAAASDILLSASTSEAYAFLFKLLCDPGDAVLVPAPSYPLFEHLAELEGVQALPYRLVYDGAWHIDFAALARAITPPVRAIVVVSPNNPTGQYLRQSERDELAALGLPLISDEVFAPFPLRASVPVATRANHDCLTFTLDGLSKRAGSPQLKLGWTVVSGPERVRREACERLELIADTYLSVNTPIQQALPDLLELCPAVAAAISARCRQNLAFLERAVQAAPLTLLRAEAGWSSVLQLPAVASEEQLVLGLLREADVLVQPGWYYDFESEPYAVVSLLSEPSVFQEGTERLVQYVTRVAG